MGTKTEVILIDDLDGGRADETVSFALDGIGYELELSAKNSGELREFMARYIDVSRRTGRVAAPQQRGKQPRGGAPAGPRAPMHNPPAAAPQLEFGSTPPAPAQRTADTLINRTNGAVAIAPPKRLSSTDIDPAQKKDIRAWGNKKAEENPQKFGHLASGTKGRLKQELLDAYQDAHA